MIKKLFKFIKSLFVNTTAINESAWVARNVWNDPNLAKEDNLYKGKKDES